MPPIFNVSYRKVGGLRFVRIGRLQLSFCVVKRRSINDAQRMDACRALTALAPIREVRRYPAGSTVVVYDDR